MAKPIEITMEDGKKYVLDFSRESVVYAETHGFGIADLADENKLLTTIPELFFYAFRKNHPEVTKEQSDHILFDELGGIADAWMERLGELFSDTYLSLRNEEGKPKNPKVRVTL